MRKDELLEYVIVQLRKMVKDKGSLDWKENIDENIRYHTKMLSECIIKESKYYDDDYEFEIPQYL